MKPNRITFRESLDYSDIQSGPADSPLGRVIGAGILYAGNRVFGDDKTGYPGWNEVSPDTPDVGMDTTATVDLSPSDC